MAEHPTIPDLETRVRQESAYRKQLPGMSSMLSLDIVSVDETQQEIVTSFTADPWAENVNGTIHGGVITSVIDSSMGILCHSTLYPKRAPTINLNISFLRPVMKGQTLYTRAKLLRRGKNLLWFQSVSWVENPEKPCATGEGTFYCSNEK